MKLFVVGSSGQIGTAVMKVCRDSSIEAIGLDKRANEWDSTLTHIVGDFLHYNGEELKGVTDILFLATEASAAKLENDSKTNEEDYALFDRAITLSKRLGARLTIVSSRELFDMTPERLSSFVSKTIYEKQKKDFELKLYNLEKQGLKTGVIRAPIVFGGYDTDLERLPRLVPRWCKQALIGEAVKVENGENEIELILAEEVASKVVKNLLEEKASFIKDVHGLKIKLNDLAELIYDIVNNRQLKNGADSEVLRFGIKTTLDALAAS